MNRTSDEKSCGAVIFRQTRGVRRFLLIQSAYSGAWGFPKGHMEAGESEGDTAVRDFLPDFRVSISYPLPTGAMKEVVYFLAEAADAEAHLQRAEVRSAVWLPAEQVLELLSFDNLRTVFRAALLYLRADGASEPAPIVN